MYYSMDDTNRSDEFCKWLDTFRGRDLTQLEVLGLRIGIENHYRNIYHGWCQTTKTKTTVENESIRNAVMDLFEPRPVLPPFSDSEKRERERPVKGIAMAPQKQKRVVIVEHRVETVADIIAMIEAYPLAEGIEYGNIDMAPLHRIRDELIELEEMIGLESLKRSIVDQLLYFIQDFNDEKDKGDMGLGGLGLDISATDGGGDYKHVVLFGPPGTGKTEVARLIGRMYSKLGILKNGVFKKVVRSDLIAGYVGQTAIKTRAVINECLGGVLFIDEAYSLATDDQFSSECIDTLCEALSDHKDNLMVIVAGYEEPMKRVFFKANPGLESRFIWRFKMPGYNAKELKSIFEKKVSHAGWEISSGVPSSSLSSSSSSLQKWFDDKMKHFAHFGRDIEMLFIYTKVSHSRRIYASSSSSLEKKKITIDDLDEGFRLFRENSFHEESVSSRTSISMMYI
jgi:Cdc6-like AAA superfamily ATPase